MAPNLAPSQHDQIRDMIVGQSLTNPQMADVAGSSIRTIKSIRANLRCFGNTKAPRNGCGRPRSLTPPMLDALCEHLLEKPDLYLDEMAVFPRGATLLTLSLSLPPPGCLCRHIQLAVEPSLRGDSVFATGGSDSLLTRLPPVVRRLFQMLLDIGVQGYLAVHLQEYSR